MTSRRNSHGFTLVEVLVVIVIIGIASMVVIPQMLNAGTLQIQAAGRMVVSDILYAQNEAATRQVTRRVVFDVASDRYMITDSDGAVLASSWRQTKSHVVDFMADDRFQGVSLDAADFAGSSALEFDDLGAPQAGGTVDLTFQDIRYRVTVAPFTGRVTIAPVEEVAAP